MMAFVGRKKTCKADRVREKNVLWTNRIEISVRKKNKNWSVGRRLLMS